MRVCGVSQLYVPYLRVQIQKVHEIIEGFRTRCHGNTTYEDLRDRLNQWAESLDKYTESQNGYHSARSTTDNTFTLMACAQR